MSTLSIIILTKNEEKNITDVINNIKTLADEIIVVDSGSTDKTVELANIPAEGWSLLDVGEKTIAAINAKLDECKTLVWNGPLGVFEMKPFDNATNKVAEKAAILTGEGRLMTVAGGGDTVSAMENAGVADKFSYVSTAGGAFLEWMEGKELPGVVVLKK